MRYQLRLLDQNLPGFARQLARLAWTTVERVADRTPDHRLLRPMYRAVRRVLKDRLQAFRYCGATHRCEDSLEPAGKAVVFSHEAWPGEHVKVYLLRLGTTPAVLEQELTVALNRAAVEALPGVRLPGVARALRAISDDMLRPQIFTAEECGETPLCSMNEPYDPWDRMDLTNALRPAPRLL